MAKDLSGLPIAITGASSGIGRATAIACARAGMPVALMARREGPLREAADAVETEGVRASVFVGSVDVPGASEAFIKQAEADLGPLHAVFANAGYGAERETLAMTAADLRTMFEVNFWASLRLAQCVTPGMIERGRGHVLFCSSCLSKIGLPRYASYCASKACQDHFARALRHELRPAGVHVSSVHPIGTKTAFFDAAAARSGGRPPPDGPVDRGVHAAAVARGRRGRPLPPPAQGRGLDEPRDAAHARARGRGPGPG